MLDRQPCPIYWSKPASESQQEWGVKVLFHGTIDIYVGPCLILIRHRDEPSCPLFEEEVKKMGAWG